MRSSDGDKKTKTEITRLISCSHFGNWQLGQSSPSLPLPPLSPSPLLLLLLTPLGYYSDSSGFCAQLNPPSQCPPQLTGTLIPASYTPTQRQSSPADAVYAIKLNYSARPFYRVYISDSTRHSRIDLCHHPRQYSASRGVELRTSPHSSGPSGAKLAHTISGQGRGNPSLPEHVVKEKEQIELNRD